MNELKQVKFKLHKDYLKPVFASSPCLTNKEFVCMLDSGAGIPVWCTGQDSLLDTFPTAKYKESYKNLLGGFGAVFQAVKVYYIPKIEFSNGKDSLMFEDFYLPVSVKRNFGVDLILPTSMIKESKIILSQIDVKHEGKTLEFQCSTRYFKARYTLKHLFASDVTYYKKLFEQQKMILQKQKELDISMHDILIGSEGEFDRILTQEEINTETEYLENVQKEQTNSTESSLDAKPVNAFFK